MASLKKYILINRGFSGTYLETKLGHELINFVADDRGRQWCFINKDGQLAFDKYGKVEWVINTILVRRGVFEVLNVMNVKGGHLEVYKNTPDGKVRLHEEHTKYLKSQDIRFGGVVFHDLFHDLSVVTFRAEQVYLPRKRIILTHEDLTGDPLAPDSIHLEMINNSTGKAKQLGNQSARTYVSNKDGAYELLLSLISNPEYFKKGYQPQFADIILGYPMSFCEKDSDVVDLTEYIDQKQRFIEAIKSKQRN